LTNKNINGVRQLHGRTRLPTTATFIPKRVTCTLFIFVSTRESGAPRPFDNKETNNGRVFADGRGTRSRARLRFNRSTRRGSIECNVLVD
jgi:hypothetical protein